MKRKLRIYKLLYEAFWVLLIFGFSARWVVADFLNKNSNLNLYYKNALFNKACDQDIYPLKKKYIFKRLRIFKEILEEVL